MKIVIGCDEAAYTLKEVIKRDLIENKHEVIDVGVYDEKPSLYPDIAAKLCEQITNRKAKRGILLCGTGIGMAITANKIPGIRAAVAHDVFSLERMIKSNDCQILCMGARVIAPQSAQMLVQHWLEIEFVEGPSSEKVNRIMEIEAKYSR